MSSRPSEARAGIHGSGRTDDGWDPARARLVPGLAGMTASSLPPRRARFALPQGSLAWRAFVIQAVVLVLVAAFLGWVAANVIANITRLNINTGFSFLSRPAGFEIAQKLIGFGEAATYFDVFLVALLNTV